MKTLREWRLSRLLSVRALADKASVSTKTVMDAEHGVRTPTLQTMRKLCDALDVDAFEVEEFANALGDLGKEVAA